MKSKTHDIIGFYSLTTHNLAEILQFGQKKNAQFFDHRPKQKQQ